jgi:hypothetical protein
VSRFVPLLFDVDVKPGETIDLGDVRADTGVNIAGTVLDADGKPAAGVSVGSGVAHTSSDESGRFTLTPVSRGRVVLLAHWDRFVAQLPLDTTAPPKDVKLRLVKSRLVRVETTPAARSPRFGVRAKPRGATRDALPLPLPQMDDNMTFGYVDCRGVAVLPLLPGDWTLEAVAIEDVVLATSGVSVPAGDDDPVRSAIEVR